MRKWGVLSFARYHPWFKGLGFILSKIKVTPLWARNRVFEKRHKLRLGRGRKKESLDFIFLVKTSECISASTMIHILESSNTYRIW